VVPAALAELLGDSPSLSVNISQSPRTRRRLRVAWQRVAMATVMTKAPPDGTFVITVEHVAAMG
jgi:hypothetical protein